MSRRARAREADACRSVQHCAIYVCAPAVCCVSHARGAVRGARQTVAERTGCSLEPWPPACRPKLPATSAPDRPGLPTYPRAPHPSPCAAPAAVRTFGHCSGSYDAEPTKFYLFYGDANSQTPPAQSQTAGREPVGSLPCGDCQPIQRLSADAMRLLPLSEEKANGAHIMMPLSRSPQATAEWARFQLRIFRFRQSLCCHCGHHSPSTTSIDSTDLTCQWPTASGTFK